MRRYVDSTSSARRASWNSDSGSAKRTAARQGSCAVSTVRRARAAATPADDRGTMPSSSLALTPLIVARFARSERKHAMCSRGRRTRNPAVLTLCRRTAAVGVIAGRFFDDVTRPTALAHRSSRHDHFTRGVVVGSTSPMGIRVDRLVVASPAKEYGDADVRPFVEEDVANPRRCRRGSSLFARAS